VSRYTIIIPTSRGKVLHSTINSIILQTERDWELIVVSQGNDEEISKVVKKYIESDNRIKYLNIARKGASRARNAGIESSSGELIALIDDDCEAARDWLETYSNLIEKHPDVGLFGGSVVRPSKPQSRIGVCPHVIPAEVVFDPRKTPDNPPPGFYWFSANVVMRRKVYEAVGPFDEYLGPGTEFPGAEDTDYMLRVGDLGIPMASTPKAVVDHTYGYRYGWKQVYKYVKSYNYAVHGLAGKLTLAGDPRGKAWMENTRRNCSTSWLSRPYLLPVKVNRYYHANKAYRLCMRNYVVVNGFLKPKLEH
jgi:glycosyltransferase involved in cell wall biosynthesis